MTAKQTVDVPRDAAAEAWHPLDMSGRSFTRRASNALWGAAVDGDADDEVPLTLYDEATARAIVVVLTEAESRVRDEGRDTIADRYEMVLNAVEPLLGTFDDDQ